MATRFMTLTHLVKFMECSANVKQVSRIEKHWFVVDRVGWMRRNANHWQRHLTKTISNGNRNLIKDNDEVLTKYSTAN